MAPHVGLSSLDVVLVGTYPPTECGLATYTANLHDALASVGAHATVARLSEATSDEPDRSGDVVATWLRDLPRGSDALFPALDACDVVLLQHEFGIYPGQDGETVLDLVQRCVRPVISVLHTVLGAPSAHQAAIVEQLGRESSRLVVHTESARVRLLAAHDIDAKRLAVIPHGAAPNLGGPGAVSCTHPLIVTWGLLGPGKGIEHAIESIAIMRAHGLDVRYLVAGETHPKVRARDGEAYRQQLEALARQRGVADLVEFDGVYRDWPALQAIVRSATLVLLPYDSHDQVTSGVLVEALAAGKPVVATAFPHAVDLSATGAVAVVDHQDPDRCARTIMRILTHPTLLEMMASAAAAEGARYDWAIVGRQFADLAETAALEATLLDSSLLDNAQSGSGQR